MSGCKKVLVVSPLAGGPAEETERYSKKQGFYLSDGLAAATLMILPQVHLRKPCYDFYFL